MSAISTIATTPAANGMASEAEPNPGRAPVLWAEVL